MRENIFIFTDGGARGNPGPSGVGVFISSSDGVEIYQEHAFLGHKTNNEAEYLALQKALRFLKGFLTNKASDFSLTFHLDSKLVVEQMNRRWKIKEARLLELAKQNWQLLESLPHCTFEIKYIPREQNQKADALANEAMDTASSNE